MKKLAVLYITITLFSYNTLKAITGNSEKSEIVVTTFQKAKSLIYEFKTNLIDTIKRSATSQPKQQLTESSPKTQEDLHAIWQKILRENVSDNGIVDYKNLKSNPTELQLYIDKLAKNSPTDEWSREEKLAYWINAYNALTIDLILYNYPIESIRNIKDPWDRRLWKIGGKWITLNQLEHNILRKMKEPRIHFAIVCASYSCPKLQNEAFTASDLDAQLTKVTKEFLNDPERNKISENQLELSKIFKWFAKDFKANGGLISFLNTYTDIEISKKAKKTFLDYNWDLND